MPTPAFRYQGLSYAALNVTDLARSVPFYRDVVGLELVRSDDRHALLRCAGKHHDIMLVAAAEPGLKRVGFAMESARDLELARAHFAGLGLAPRAVAADELADLGVEAAFRIREPASQLELEFLHGMAAAESEFAASHTRFARLGHIVIHAADLDATLGFLVNEANFRVSDFVEGRISFLRAFPNPLHHSFAVGAGGRNALHHVNFMVNDIDDVGKAMNRMRANGSEIVFGPGRHEPSGSIFLYFLDPDGMTLEFSFGMEEFPEADPRDARPLEQKPEVLDIWGGLPAPRFAKVGAIEAPAAETALG